MARTRSLNIILTLVIVFLLLPYLVLAFNFLWLESKAVGVSPKTLDAFNFTALQAGLSAVFALLLGVVGSFGLLGLRRKLNTSRLSLALDFFVLLPNIIPVLFVVLAALNLVPHLNGLIGIVALHTLINVGLVAVTFEYLIRESAGAYLELARVEGASRFSMVFKVILPVMKKDISLLALTVFALSFTSFAVPLIIGGSRATTTEVLIYELIRVDLNWSQALLVAVVQALVIMAISFIIGTRRHSDVQRETRIEFLGFAALSVVALAPSFLLIIGLLSGVFEGVTQLFREIPISELAPLFANSFFISLGTAVLSLMFLSVIAFSQPGEKGRKIILGLIAPSSLLTGFALLLLWRETGFASLIKIIFGLSLVFVPILYRLGWDAKLSSLSGQMRTASVLGATRLKTFVEIVWPQMQGVAARLAGLASFWAWGDFALSKVVAERTLTVPLLIQSLMSSYRLNSATALLWFLLFASAVTYMIVWSAVNCSRLMGRRRKV